jgi:formylglycine-generating enzyme required for sulfatase activity
VALLAGAKAARGTASAVWSLVDALCYRDLSDDEAQSEPDAWGALLAGQALVESADLDKVSERNRVKVERVQAHLVHVMEEGQLPAVERAAAGRALAKLGDPRRGVGLREDGLPDIAWCEVTAGPFLMGEGDNQHRNETITEGYLISRYPVTNAQFEAFVRAGGYQEGLYWREAIEEGYWNDGAIKARWDNKPYTAPEDYGEPYNLHNHPVVGVTWYEAVAFCRWLTEVLRKQGGLGEGEEITLPSEAQWEKAARGTDGRVYPWGSKSDPERANYEDTGIGTTSAVGCFSGGKSPYEVEDASGNVWEWIRDDPGVVRGGSFDYSAGFVRCAARLSWNPNSRNGYLGFRVVVAPFSQSVDL